MEELWEALGISTRPRRRWSRELPPDLSELMNRLSSSFIREFDNRKHRMGETVRRFQNVASEVRRMQERSDSARTAGAVGGGTGLGGREAPFTGGLSWLVGAVGAVVGAVVGAAGATATAAAAAAAYVDAKAKKTQIAEKVLKLGQEFLQIVDPLKNELEEIKRTCEQLEEESAAVQAEKTLSDMEEFQRILRRVAELRRKERTAEEDRKFRESITKSADQSQKIVDAFEQMKKELSQFPGNETFRRFLV